MMFAPFLAGIPWLRLLPWLGVVIASGLFYWKDGQVQDLRADLAVSQANVQTMAEAAESQRQARIDMQTRYETLIASDAALRANYDRLRADYAIEAEKIHSYRERWSNVATKKPNLVSRIINRATDKRVREFYKITCRTDCDGGGDGGGAKGQKEPTGPD